MKNIFYLLFLCFNIMACDDDTGSMQPPTNSLPAVSLDPLDVSEGDEDKSIFASVRLSKVSSETVTIFVETEDGTALAGVDYLSLSTSIEFEPGDVQENIKLDILGDEDSEIDESFKLKIVNVAGATIGTGEVDIIINNDDLGDGNVVIPATGYSTPESYEGCSLLWSDEFTSERLNESFWTYEIGNGNSGWGNNESQFYKRENTSIVDGHLVIQAREEFANGFEYTSSRIITKNKFDFQFGRVDIRAVLPEGQGIWPALWMLGANIDQVSWPRCGEIDIMELIGHQPSTIHGTVHHPDSDGSHLFKGSSTSLSGGQKFSQEFHVFSIIWEEDKIEFLMDDRLYYTITPTVIGAQNPYPFNQSFFFIFNVAVGGNWPGYPDASTVFPQAMIVDYIRVFEKG